MKFVVLSEIAGVSGVSVVGVVIHVSGVEMTVSRGL
jgi:hypothetical protein